MKNKKKLSLKKMSIAQLDAVKGGNLDPRTITARNTSPILCNFGKSVLANCDNPTQNEICQTTVRQTFIEC